MDNENKPTAEELEQEKTDLATAQEKEEEVRAKVITEFGFDEVDDLDRINKLVAKEMDSRKKLSSAIGQKIKHRDAAEELRKKVPPPPKKDEVIKKDEVTPELIDKALDSKLEQRDLDALPYSDELKKDIKKVASSLGITVKAALKDPYVVFKVKEEEKELEIDEATINRNNKSGGGKGKSSFDNPPDVDMTTPEGRKKWDDWKADQVKKGN